MAVGRKPTKNTNLPQGVRARTQKSGKTYYYYEVSRNPSKEIPLGCDYVLAMKKWAEMSMTPVLPENVAAPTMRYAVERYFESPAFNKLEARTQKDYKAYSKKVLEFFDDPPAPLDSIKPSHIQLYLEWRQDAEARANRERAFISLVWNYARRTDLTERPNPCAGVKGYTETGRDIYIEDQVMSAVYECANNPLKDAIDIAYLTTQRPADTLKMSEHDLKDTKVLVEQNKTDKKLRINNVGELNRTLERIKARKAGMKVHSLRLIVTDTGKPVSYAMLWDYFDEARREAARRYPKLAEEIKAFQFRDLRAKGITDKTEKEGTREAQKLAGHASITTTDGYVRNRKGESVDPVK